MTAKRELAFQQLGKAIAALAAVGVAIRHSDELEEPRKLLDEIDTALMNVKGAVEDSGLDDAIGEDEDEREDLVYLRALMENS